MNQIGRYEIKRELGRGGMATVYLANDPRFQREVAIKVLPHQFMHDPRFLERFEQEARTIAALEHYAIVPVYDFGEEDDAPYLVMRYMSGGSLRDRMGGKSLPLPETSRILERLAKALDRAHEMSIIHRDLKPGNVLFDREDLPYLGDFGIARMAEATHTMTVVGTPGYMSPEQVQGQLKLDWRSDIYALGVLLFEMLTGRQPFEAETPSGQMFMHVMEPVPDVLALNSTLPPQTQTVIDKAMAKDREERYQTAEALAQAVQQLLATPPQAVEPPLPLTMPAALESEANADPLPHSVEAVPFEAIDKTTFDAALEEPLAPAAPDSAVEDKRQDLSSATPFPGSASPRKREAGVPAWAWWVGAFVVILLLVFGIYAVTRDTDSKIAQATRILAEETDAAAVVPEAAEEPLEEPGVENQQAEVTAGEITQEPTAADAQQSANCENPLGCVVIPPDDPILLASALVISGPNAELGQDSQHGVELALDFREEVLGHPLKLQAEDDGCSAEGGQTAASKIVSNPQVVALIGTSCTAAGIPASKIISDAGYVMVSPSNTSPALTDPAQAFQEGYLRTSPNDLVQGQIMANFAFNEMGVTRAAVIHDGDPYTKGLATRFASIFEEFGGQIVAFEAEVPDATDVAPLLTSIASGEPEFIFYPVFIPLASIITNTARDIEGLENVFLAASDGVQSPSFLENTIGTSEGLYASGPDLNFENAFYKDELLPAYREKFGSDPIGPFHAHAYDATMMVLDAVEFVAQREEDGTLIISRQALRDALYNTSEYEGITGMLTCSKYGDCADDQVSVSIVEGNECVRIWP